MRPLTLPRSVGLALISSATEVFPRECMGCICCDGFGRIAAAFPYQLAIRRAQAVSSDSASVFDKLLESGPFLKLGDFHSHTFQANEKIPPLEPSNVDLEELEVGGIEIIVQVRRTRKKRNNWRNSKDGISIAWGRFRFLICAFMRIKGIDSEGIPLYKRIRTCLEGSRSSSPRMRNRKRHRKFRGIK